MRARHRHFIAALIAAIAATVTLGYAPSVGAVRAEGPLCPQGTSWDNRIQRCV